jgi:hypothetical protein
LISGIFGKKFMGTHCNALVSTQLEIKSGNPLKISGKGGSSRKHRLKKS